MPQVSFRKMTEHIRIFFLLLLAASAIVDSFDKRQRIPLQADECGKIIDTDVILEVPLEERKEAIEQSKIFFKSIFDRKESKRCWRIRFTIAYAEIYRLNIFPCIGKGCVSTGLKSINEIPVELEDGQNPMSPKENVFKALQSLEMEVKDNLDLPEERLVVLMLSSKPFLLDGRSISDEIKILLENRFSFIAVGIGEGREENLNNIASNGQRVFIKDFASLNKKENVNKILSQLDSAVDSFHTRQKMPVEASLVRSVSVVGLSKDAENMYDKVFDEESEETCNYIADICFLIDSSGSIKENTDFVTLKKFVMRLADRFKITEDGTHGSAVVFSDKYPHTKVTIKLNDYYSTRAFKEAISKTPHINYRTRIDLAFELADKEVFVTKNGARPNVKKIIFLLTDGKQNPSIYDPVKASENLINEKVNIYAVGIGKDIDEGQLANITRDQSKVFFAETFDSLDSQGFVDQVSKKACSPGVRPTTDIIKKNTTVPVTTPCTTPRKHGCAGVGRCETCCGSGDVYINIFQPNSGPSYVIQGMKMEQTVDKGSISGISLPPKGPNVPVSSGNDQFSTDQLIRIIQQSLNNNPTIAKSIVNILKNSSKKKDQLPLASIVTEEEEEEEEKRRRRRSISAPKEGMKGFQVVKQVAKLTGCNLFFAALKKYDLLHNISAMMKNKETVTLFCPIDAAFKKIFEANSVVTDEKSILLHHIGVKHDRYGKMYRTLLPGGNILFNPVGEDASKLSWKANDADVLLSITNGKHGEIVVLKDMIFPAKRGVLDVLKTLKNVDIFRRMLLSSKMSKVFSSTKITSICFAKDTCVPISGPLQEHLKDAIDFRQYTIIVPTDSVFDNMPVSKLRSLMADPKLSHRFLQEHVFLGSLSDQGSNLKEVAYSVSPRHSLMTMNMKDGRAVLTDSNNRLFEVKKTVRVAEGILHIVDLMR